MKQGYVTDSAKVKNVPNAKRLRQLEEKNTRLKKLAELDTSIQLGASNSLFAGKPSDQ